MSFQRRIKYFLVHALSLSNKAAQALIESGALEINSQPVTDNCHLPDAAEIKINGVVKRPKTTFVYLKFNKPPGYQSSLSPAVTNNLAHFFKGFNGLAIAGRLDQASEGLLLLSNDGKWVETICNPRFEKEKEYEVTLNKAPDAAFIKAFRAGVSIGGYITKHCVCELVNENVIRVILTEGKNRQIRRMCHVLGYSVMRLKRLRIAGVALNGLKPGSCSSFEGKAMSDRS